MEFNATHIASQATAQIITFPTTLAAPVKQPSRCASRMRGVAVLGIFRAARDERLAQQQQRLEAIKTKRGAIVCLMNAAEVIQYEIAAMA